MVCKFIYKSILAAIDTKNAVLNHLKVFCMFFFNNSQLSIINYLSICYQNRRTTVNSPQDYRKIKRHNYIFCTYSIYILCIYILFVKKLLKLHESSNPLIH